MVEPFENRNPESRLDAALNLIASRRQDPTAFRPPQGHGMNPLQALEALGKNFIRDPLSAAMSYASLSQADHRQQREGAPWWTRALSGVKEPLDWFNMDRWGEARGTQGSLGQSVLLGALTDDIRDPEQLRKARESQWYKKGSGVVDLGARIFVDPNALLFGRTMTELTRRAAAKGVQTGGPAAAAGIRSAAEQNRLGLRSPNRWLGEVDPPDARPSVQTTTSPSGLTITSTDIHPGGSVGYVHGGAHRFDTPRYLDEIRASRPGGRSPAWTVENRVPTSTRRQQSRKWQDVMLRRIPILEDGYAIPMMEAHPASGLGWIPERGVLVQLDEAGQVVGKPIRAAGDTTVLEGRGLIGYDKPVSPNWITDDRRAGWYWVHDLPAGRVTPAQSVHGPAVNSSGVYKVAMTGDEVAASSVDDLLERFDGIGPDDGWDLETNLAVMTGGVFKGTAASGKTLAEIGELVSNGAEAERIRRLPKGYVDGLDLEAGLFDDALSPAEAKKIWPTLRRMYADEAVDNILTARGDDDTMRLRALFYDDPTMANNHTFQSAINDFLERSSERLRRTGRTPPTFASTTGLHDWDVALYGPPRVGNVGLGFDRRVYAVEEIRELIVADLRAITRKFADDVGLPERVSVGRWQSPGERIGMSGSTHPMDPKWAREINRADFQPYPRPMLYGQRGPGGMGTESPKWIEAVVDPRKDIDFFMLSRTGSNFGEHEILMSPKTWAEKAVGGLGSPLTARAEGANDFDFSGAIQHIAPRDMPGLTSAQIELGPNAPRWLPRLIEELTAAGVEPDLVKRFIKEPAGRGREALTRRVTAELDVTRRNTLEGQGWTNLPTPGAIRVVSQVAGGLVPIGADEALAAVKQIASGTYDAADWFRFGKTYTLPTPPNWDEFAAQLSQEMSAILPRPGVDVPPKVTKALKAFKDWVELPGRATWDGLSQLVSHQSLSGIVGWTVREGATDLRPSMELLPGWKDRLKRLVDDWYNKHASAEFRP